MKVGWPHADKFNDSIFIPINVYSIPTDAITYVWKWVIWRYQVILLLHRTGFRSIINRPNIIKKEFCFPCFVSLFSLKSLELSLWNAHPLGAYCLTQKTITIHDTYFKPKNSHQMNVVCSTYVNFRLGNRAPNPDPDYGKRQSEDWANAFFDRICLFPSS